MATELTTAGRVRIFISSPGDVQEERERARQVIEGLRRRYSRSLRIEPVFWEDLPLQPEMSFQQGIDLVISGEVGIDIAIFILWSRLGSPLGKSILKSDQSEYLSGTEREYDLIMAARQQSAGGLRRRPEILFYRRLDDNSFDERLRGKSTAEQRELVRQKELVEAFFSREFQDNETGVNRRPYYSYERPSKFSQKLTTHLISLLDPIVGDLGRTTIWDTAERGPPFVGLEAFRIEHADVFFGREEETLEARRALSEQARNGCAFLLISGPSGSGKSSLAQAGVAPAIIENELDDHVAAWRVLIVTPSELAPNPIEALVARTAAAEVLSELVAEVPPADIAALLAHNPGDAWKLLLKPAFKRASQSAGGGVRLLLVIDQLEELFGSAGIGVKERRAFLDASRYWPEAAASGSSPQRAPISTSRSKASRPSCA